MAVNKRLLQGAAAGGLVPSENFKAVLYTGNWNGSNTNFVEVGFQPDWVWIKDRGNADNHRAYDTSRPGTNNYPKGLYPNLTDGEFDGGHISIQSTGFTLLSDNNNVSGRNYVAWCWKADGGTTSSNTDGSITSTVQANQEAGFSIVTWTGDGNISTVGHGLSQVPEMVITKGRANLATYNQWSTYHHSLAENHVIYLNLTNASQSAGEDNYFDDSTFSNTVFGVGDDQYGPNVNGTTMVAYCFHSVAGYSKMGSYTGNGGTLTVSGLGFQPDFLIVKNTTLSNTNWGIVDSVRGEEVFLQANKSNSEDSLGAGKFDFLSDGFRYNSLNSINFNSSGSTFIYMAIKIN